jgi:tetratricopeptide (TPR) repeat protein
MNLKPFLFFLLIFLSATGNLVAQVEPLDVNKFVDSFYESLKQKGIENYDKAISSLEICLKLEPENATVHFELGKNYLALKDYKNAYRYFEQAAQIDPTNKWFFIGMYDVDYETKNFKNAVKTIHKLIPFDPKFKEDLTSLYMNTGQFDEALALINELNQNVGKTDRRESYKMQILSQGKYQDTEIANLLEEIRKNPKEEANYISLIYLYSKHNDEKKMLETAKLLETEIPKSEWAQVSLFKNYIEKNDGKKAVSAMNIVLGSDKIDSKIKHRVLNEFLLFTNKNPQFDPDLEKAIQSFDSDREINVAKEVAKFYHSKKQWDKAIPYYQKAIKKNSSTDIETNLLLLQAYTEIKNFNEIAPLATEMISIFPAQPQFYYYAGLAQNQLSQFKKAKDVLEMGMDFVVEDVALEINFNIQLGEAYNGLGDAAKKDFYFLKATQLLKQ